MYIRASSAHPWGGSRYRRGARAVDRALQPQALQHARTHPRGEAAVDDERVAGDEARVVGDEEQRRARDLLGPAEPPELVLLAVALAVRRHARAVHHRPEHRRVDEARADAVHAHAAPAVVDREVLRE